MQKRESLEQQYIEIKGARVNNLKNISLNIPTGKLVVITGLSGSGKSSLAFDTLYAEGQRRYVESLSAYTRQFLGRIDKPEVDSIKGIAPAIAIEQKVISRNSRSTVGTTTEIYDYLKLLYARAGETFSPVSGKKVEASSVADIVDYIHSIKSAGTLYILARVSLTPEHLIEKVVELVGQGYDRIFYNNQFIDVPTLMADIDNFSQNELMVLIGKMPLDAIQDDMELSDTISLALELGTEHISIATQSPNGEIICEPFSTLYEADGIVFDKPFEQMFSFNNPLGACPLCSGYGKVTGIDEDLVIPDKTKSIVSDAVAPWRGELSSYYKNEIINSAFESGFPIHKPYCELTLEQKALLWKGCDKFTGIDGYFAILEKERYKIQCRVIIARYTGKRVCPECEGHRLKKQSLYVRVGGYRISDLANMSVENLLEVIRSMELSDYQRDLSKRLIVEITNRIGYLNDVGLGYLTLDRLSNTLSGGESQRINLASSLGSSLVGSMYILDEPSIGLHPRDTQRLIGVLKSLRDLGNSVIVVEHDEEIMRAADHIIDIGPAAGAYGGEVVFEGSIAKLINSKGSLTADYLTGRKVISSSLEPRNWSQYIEIKGARENNLKEIDVKFPLRVMCAVTGVSGSGKSSLVSDILYPALSRYTSNLTKNIYNHDDLAGDLNEIATVEMIDQNPIGRSSRSNPVTYIKAYDDIRKLFSSLPIAKSMSLTPSSFSFNIAGGRCEECQGEGVTRVEMQFMADVVMPCEVCSGKRFKEEICRVEYKGKSITDVLDMSISEAIAFFRSDDGNGKIVEKLQENSSKPILFIFDEPTTGLHFEDIKKLLKSLNRLVDRGHTVVVVEHNMDVVKCCDWVIDLGAEGGDKGGQLVCCGTPSQVADCKDGYTSAYLRKMIL